jgi:hypothetical protein
LAKKVIRAETMVVGAMSFAKQERAVGTIRYSRMSAAVKMEQQNKWATITSRRPEKLVCRKMVYWKNGAQEKFGSYQGTGFSRAESKS